MNEGKNISNYLIEIKEICKECKSIYGKDLDCINGSSADFYMTRYYGEGGTHYYITLRCEFKTELPTRINKENTIQGVDSVLKDLRKILPNIRTELPKGKRWFYKEGD